MKYYAVKAGRETGVFTTWTECQKQVTGFKGAAFKSFSSEEEAWDFVNGSEMEEELPECEAYAYTDGSYNNDTGLTGGGGILYYAGETYEFLISTGKRNTEYNEMRNIGGEILASAAAILKAKELGVRSLRIYHDYEGVGLWADGKQKANKSATKSYALFCDAQRSGGLELQFVHVKAHTGIKDNELADELAKYAVGLADSEMRVEHPNMQWIDMRSVQREISASEQEENQIKLVP